MYHYIFTKSPGKLATYKVLPTSNLKRHMTHDYKILDYTPNLDTVQITFIFIDFRVCDFAFAFKTQNAPCVSRFKRILFSDRFQFAF